MNYFNSDRFPADLMDDPERYLGPNYKTVINFYELYVANKIFSPDNERLDIVDPGYRSRLRCTVFEIIPEDIATKLHWSGQAYELVAMHLLLERGETLKYLPRLSYR